MGTGLLALLTAGAAAQPAGDAAPAGGAQPPRARPRGDAPPPRARPRGDAPPVSAQLTIGATKIIIGGTVKLDVIHSSNSRGQASDPADYLLLPGQLPLLNEIPVNVISSRSSLLFVQSTTPTRYGDMVARLELLPLGLDPVLGAEFALRMATVYATLGPVLAGRTWSTWMDVETRPETNDFGSPAGWIVARSPQLRYTLPLEPLGGNFQLAIENNESVFTRPDGTRVGAAGGVVPDLVAKLVVSGAWGRVSMAGLVRRLRNPGLLPTMPTVTDTALAYGGRVGGTLMLGGKNNLQFEASIGRGFGVYVALSAYADAELGFDGTLRPIELAAGLLAAQVWLTDTVRINLVGSMSQALNNAPSLAYFANKRLSSAHANIMWDLLAPVRIGIEYITARRELENGASGTLHRVQGAVRFLF